MAKKRGNGEGCIRLLKTGYWEARITIGYNEIGKQRFKTFAGKSRQIVARKLSNYIANEKSKEPEIVSKITLSEWLDKWYENYVIPNVKISTRVSYEMIIRRHLKPRLGHIQLRNLNKEMIENMYRSLVDEGRTDRKGGLSVKSIKNIHLVLRKALDEASISDYIIKNPAGISKVPTMRSTNGTKKKIEILTKDEQIKLISVCSNNAYDVAVRLFLFTGMRLGELLGLQWENVDFEKRRIKIDKQLNRLKDFDSEANKRTKLRLQNDGKTKNSLREIYLSQNAIEMLTEYKEYQDIEIEKWGKAYVHKGMVFAREDGNFMDPSTFRSHYKKLLAQAGLKNYTIHALRHSFATRALEAGVPIKVVSDILGHAGVQITMDTYSHVLPELQEDAMQKISDYMNF